jgi:hypothetical protein
LRGVGRPTKRSVGRRMSGPGDRAPKPAFSGNVNADALPIGGRPRRGSNESGLGRHAAPGSDEFGTLTRSVAREPGDLDVALPTMVSGEPAQEGENPQAEPTSVEKSDEVVVPKKSAKTRVTPFESTEGRTEAKGKSVASSVSSTQREQETLRCSRWENEQASASADPRWKPGAGNPLAGFCPGGGPKGPSLPE